MPTITVTPDQVSDLVRQLADDDKTRILRELHEERWRAWQAHAEKDQESIRVVATERGLNWDTMTEEEQEDFIQDLCEED